MATVFNLVAPDRLEGGWDARISDVRASVGSWVYQFHAEFRQVSLPSKRITISKPTVNVQVAIARANFLNRMDRYC